MRRFLSATTRPTMALSLLRTVNMSGVTRPETMASPRPQLAFTTASSRFPVTGLAVKRMPATSEGIMAWTTTASATRSCSKPCLTR